MNKLVMGGAGDEARARRVVTPNVAIAQREYGRAAPLAPGLLATSMVVRDVDPDAVAPALEAVPVTTRQVRGLAVAYSEGFAFVTTGVAPAFFDITALVRGVVQRAGIAHGQLLVTTAHTTCALIVQENEPLLLADLADRLRRFAAREEAYRHNEMTVRTVNVCGPEECANGHSHCQHALLGASAALLVEEHDVVLGRWQRLLLVELDHPRAREMRVQVTGVAPHDAL